MLRVRIICIDAPETVHPTRAIECGRAEASARLHELLDSQAVYLERDVSGTNRYRRVLSPPG